MSDAPAAARSRALRVVCLGTHGGAAGGAAIAMERLAAALRDRGVVVDVLSRAAVGDGAETSDTTRSGKMPAMVVPTGSTRTLFASDASGTKFAASTSTTTRWRPTTPCGSVTLCERT